MTKEYYVLELFFNEPTKRWHFKDIVAQAGISKERANYWLRKFKKEGLINHVKPKKKMPYFIASYEQSKYRNKKKLYALSKMHETGLIDTLQSLKKAKTIVVFGSFSRSDWHSESDVDIFIYGEPEDLRFGARWSDLANKKSREIQVHAFKTKEEIKEIKSGLMNNVIKGYFVKGNALDLVEVLP